MFDRIIKGIVNIISQLLTGVENSVFNLSDGVFWDVV